MVAAHRGKNTPKDQRFPFRKVLNDHSIDSILDNESLEKKMVINDQRHPESIRFLKTPFISHSSPSMSSPLVQRLLVAQIAKKIRPNKSVRLKNKAPFAGFSDLRGREGDGCDGYQESMGDQ